MEKFIFPERGFWAVANKISEADFFLDKMKSAPAFQDDFKYYFSAFVSAARSVTFALQYVMSSYPKFDAWYEKQRKTLREDALARFFVNTRNDSQKKGFTHIYEGGYVSDGGLVEIRSFSGGPWDNNNENPEGDICELSELYLNSILNVVGQCYRDFDTYIDPRALFSKTGLSELGWSIEDLEEYLGLPRGYSDVTGNWDDKDSERLKALSTLGFDEEIEFFLKKYNVDTNNCRFS